MKLWNEVIAETVVKPNQEYRELLKNENLLEIVREIIAKIFPITPAQSSYDYQELTDCIQKYALSLEEIEHFVCLEFENINSLKFYQDNPEKLTVKNIFNSKRYIWFRNELAKFRVKRAVKEAEKRIERQEQEIIKTAGFEGISETEAYKLVQAGPKPEPKTTAILLGCCRKPFVKITNPVLKKVTRRDDKTKIPQMLWTWCWQQWDEENRKEYEAHHTICLERIGKEGYGPPLAGFK